MLVFWGAIAWLVVYLVRRPSEASVAPPSSDPSANVSSLKILGERYAKGEIDDEEYGRRRDVLTKDT